MLDFSVAPSVKHHLAARGPAQMSLGGPKYWFLHRYFVHANLDASSSDFLNPYEDTEMSGYQLVRLRRELEEALTDLTARPPVFPVLVGWIGSTQKEEEEEWRELDREEAKRAAEELIRIIDEARATNMCVVAIGD